MYPSKTVVRPDDSIRARSPMGRTGPSKINICDCEHVQVEYKKSPESVDETQSGMILTIGQLLISSTM